jgi:hypothetical protein
MRVGDPSLRAVPASGEETRGDAVELPPTRTVRRPERTVNGTAGAPAGLLSLAFVGTSPNVGYVMWTAA